MDAPNLTTEQVRKIVGRCRYLDWDFSVERVYGQWVGVLEGHTLQGHWVCPDSEDGAAAAFHSRVWFLPLDYDESNIVKAVWGLVLAAIEHEAREAFWYTGTRIMHPHVTVEQLTKVRLAEWWSAYDEPQAEPVERAITSAPNLYNSEGGKSIEIRTYDYAGVSKGGSPVAKTSAQPLQAPAAARPVTSRLNPSGYGQVYVDWIYSRYYGTFAQFQALLAQQYADLQSGLL